MDGVCVYIYYISSRGNCTSSAGHSSTLSRHLHIFNGDVLDNLTVVNIPHSLVVPDFRCKEYGAQHDAFPVCRNDLYLRVHQQPLEVHLQNSADKRITFRLTESCLLHVFYLVENKNFGHR